MTTSVGAVVRAGLLVLVAVVLQVAGVGQIRLFGGSPDVMVLVVAGIAYMAGSVPGAICGFGAGLLLDLLIGENLGASSLILSIVGYSVGRFREVRDPSHGLMPLAVAATATAAYGVGVALVSFILEVEADVSLLFIRELVISALLAALLALPGFWFVRRVLRPVLLVDPLERRARRRPPISTGPIGLRGLGIGRQ